MTMSRFEESTRTVMSKRPSCSCLFSTSALRCSQEIPAPSAASIDRSSVVRAFASRSSIARSSSSTPSPVSADAPPPPIPVQYCYRTLAAVDCYTEAQPARVTGYTGQYPKPAD